LCKDRHEGNSVDLSEHILMILNNEREIFKEGQDGAGKEGDSRGGGGRE
jgi:hypothetical protein